MSGLIFDVHTVLDIVLWYKEDNDSGTYVLGIYFKENLKFVT